MVPSGTFIRDHVTLSRSGRLIGAAPLLGTYVGPVVSVPWSNAGTPASQRSRKLPFNSHKAHLSRLTLSLQALPVVLIRLIEERYCSPKRG